MLGSSIVSRLGFCLIIIGSQKLIGLPAQQYSDMERLSRLTSHIADDNNCKRRRTLKATDMSAMSAIQDGQQQLTLPDTDFSANAWSGGTSDVVAGVVNAHETWATSSLVLPVFGEALPVPMKGSLPLAPDAVDTFLRNTTGKGRAVRNSFKIVTNQLGTGIHANAGKHSGAYPKQCGALCRCCQPFVCRGECDCKDKRKRTLMHYDILSHFDKFRKRLGKPGDFPNNDILMGFEFVSLRGTPTTMFALMPIASGQSLARAPHFVFDLLKPSRDVDTGNYDDIVLVNEREPYIAAHCEYLNLVDLCLRKLGRLKTFDEGDWVQRLLTGADFVTCVRAFTLLHDPHGSLDTYIIRASSREDIFSVDWETAGKKIVKPKPNVDHDDDDDQCASQESVSIDWCEGLGGLAQPTDDDNDDKLTKTQRELLIVEAECGVAASSMYEDIGLHGESFTMLHGLLANGDAEEHSSVEGSENNDDDDASDSEDNFEKLVAQARPSFEKADASTSKFPAPPHNLARIFEWGANFNVPQLHAGLGYMRVQLMDPSWRVMIGQRCLGQLWGHEGKCVRAECRCEGHNTMTPRCRISLHWDSWKPSEIWGPNGLRTLEIVCFKFLLAGSMMSREAHMSLAAELQNKHSVRATHNRKP